jgi:hypothetical protein
MDLIHCLRKRWAEHDIVIVPGATKAVITAFEDRHGIRLPTDFHNYISTVDGMGDIGTTDNDLFCFFPLSDLVSIAEFVPDRANMFAEASRYFVFADHSISLPSFAIKVNSDSSAGGPVASVYSDGGALAVEDCFDSFGDFLRSYLEDPNGTSAIFPRGL